MAQDPVRQFGCLDGELLFDADQVAEVGPLCPFTARFEDLSEHGRIDCLEQFEASRNCRDMIRNTFKLIVCGVLFCGCGDTPEGEERTQLQKTLDKVRPADALFDQWHELHNKKIKTMCECSEALGATSQSACENQLGYIGPSKKKCMMEALEGDVGAVRQHLQCDIPLLQTLNTCLDNRLQCQDINSASTCGSDYDVGQSACIQLPARTQRALSNCK